MRHNSLVLALAFGAVGSLVAQELPFRQPRPSAGVAPAAPAANPSPAGKDQGTAPAASEDLLRFDPQSAEVRWINNRWMLLAGGVQLKDFGRNQAAAQEALRIIRELGLNQRGTIGTPRPVMEYWLVNGNAPEGFIPSPRRVPLDLNTLRVEQMQGQWCLRDAYRVFFAFGSHRAEADQALETIRRYRFVQVGYVGQAGMGMTYFLGDQGLGFNRMAVQQPIVSRRKTHDAPGAGAAPAPDSPVVPVTLPNGRKVAALDLLAADQQVQGDRVAFDCHRLDIQRDAQGWKLCAGDYTIGRFGVHQSAAMQAQNALQFYRCNEHCLVGQPTPVFSFFLSSGQPPRGMMFGLSGVPFRPEDLTLRQSAGGWLLCDRDRPLLGLGANVEDARGLLRVIQQQHFDHLCHIGPPLPDGINLLVRTR